MPLPELSDRQPSVLDSPRFFEESALSEWRDGNGAVAAPREALRCTPLTHSVYTDRMWPEPDNEGDPIAVEFVRGAGGPGDDTWQVVMDGMRCRLREATYPNGQTYYKCRLPSGVTKSKPISVDSVVRPVVLAIRLESEALRPMQATVTVKQVLETDERATVDGDHTEETTLQVVALPYYRISDTEASAVSLPYPFRAPSQSALGIVCYRAVEEWQEQQAALRAQNAWANATNVVRATAYSSRKIAYDAIFTNDFTEQARDLLRRGLRKGAGQLGADGYNDDLEGGDPVILKKVGVKVSKPTQPKQERQRWGRPRPTKQTTSYVIGGKKESIARELVKLFDRLRDRCEISKMAADNAVNDAARNREGEDVNVFNKGASMRQHLHAMRAMLEQDNETKEKVLLDALLSADVYPATEAFLNLRVDDTEGFLGDFFRSQRYKDTAVTQQYTVCPTAAEANQPGFDPSNFKVTRLQQKKLRELTDEERLQLKNANEDAVKREEELARKAKKNYQFNYTRLPLEARLRTTVRTKLVVEIADYGESPPVIVEIEAGEQDGIAAHAVYSGFRKDIEDLDDAGVALVNCLFQLYQERTVAAQAQDAKKNVFAPIAKVAVAIGIANKRATEKYKYTQTPNYYEWLKYYLVSVPSAAIATLAGESEFDIDPCNFEKRVAELRLMCREIMPIWPPIDDVDLSTTTFQTELQLEDPPTLQAADRPDSPQATSASSANIGAGIDEIKEQYEERARERARAAKAKRDAEQQKRIDDEIARQNADSEDLQEFLASEEQSTELVIYKPSTAVVIRRLPQIVIPSRELALTFRAPTDADPPDQYMEPEPKRWWTITQRIASFAYKLAGVAAALYSFSWLVNNIFEIFVQLRSFEYVGNKMKAFWNQANVAFQFLRGNPAGATADGIAAAVAQTAEDIAFKFGVWMDIYDSLRIAAPVAYGIGTDIVSLGTNRYQAENIRGTAFFDNKMELRGVPIVSAVNAASQAMQMVRKNTRDRLLSFGVAGNAKVIYNTLSGKRFMFYEYFADRTLVIKDLRKVAPIHGNQDWASVPDGNALAIMPPQDVAEAMYEAETLRGIPLSKTTAFVAGAAPKQAATTPFEVAAKAAHREVMQAVLHERRTLRGDHLLKSAAQTALDIAQGGAKLIGAAYSTKSGVTLVDGNDPMWTCLPAGVAARLALRHVATFLQSQAVAQSNAGDVTMAEALEYWNSPRRSMMDSFAQAWVDEAASQLRVQDPMSAPSNMPLRAVAKEAVRSFARVRAVSGDNFPFSAAVVASSVMHKIWENTSSDGLPEDVAAFIEAEQTNADAFRDQASMEFGEGRGVVGLRNAVWASRRVDVTLSRKLKSPNGAEDIIQKLAGLDIRNEDARIYYCPMGSREGGLPGRIPFATDDLGQRVVPTEYLAEAAKLVNDAVLVGENTNNDCIQVRTIKLGKLGTNRNTVGMARHPLTLSIAGNTVSVQLSAHVNVPTVAKPAPPDSLITALQSVRNSYETAVQPRIQEMRVVAFNAERMMHAIALASCHVSECNSLHVVLHDAKDCAALAIGIALYKHEEGGVVPELSVFLLEEPEFAYAAELQARAETAVADGCRVCSLAEAALGSMS